MKIIGKSWRDAATLIVLSKQSSESASRALNYDILLQTRSGSACYANSVVFPGGVTEAADASPHWLRLLGSFGYTREDFEALHHPEAPITPILASNPIQRHISLRITAIRETFEELGLLLCSREQKGNKSKWATVLSDVDVKHWQPLVSKNPEELLNLCEQYKCYPNIWALHYWSNWLTPPKRQRRFDTAFFLTALKNKPPTESFRSSSEVVNVQWLTPQEVLDKSKSELILYPPQTYEFVRLSGVPDVARVLEIAAQCSARGHDLTFPVYLRALDGVVSLLPGDDLYPLEVDYNSTEGKITNRTISELRESCKTLHRLEFGDTTKLVTKNYKPAGHIDMGDRAVEVNIAL